MTQLESVSTEQMPDPSKVGVSNVPLEQLPEVWVQLEPLMARGLRHGQGDETTTTGLLLSLIGGRSSLWVIHLGNTLLAGAIVSLTDHYTGKKIFVDIVAGKNMDLWVDALEEKLLEAKETYGAMCIECSCRPGMARYLSRRRWKRKAEIMGLE